MHMESGEGASSTDKSCDRLEDIMKEFEIIRLFRMQQSVPTEVVRAVARVHELVESSHAEESGTPLNTSRQGSSEPQGIVAPASPSEPEHKLESTGPTDDLHTKAALGAVHADEAMQNSNLTRSKPAAECTDVQMKETTSTPERSVDSDEAGEHSSDESYCSEQKRKLPPTMEGGGKQRLRRSGRTCVQIKRFKHRKGKGSTPSDPIEL